MSTAALKSVATGQAVAATHRDKPKTIAGLLTDPAIKAQMALALPKHMTVDRLARIALTEVRRVPKLAKCDQTSFLGAIMQCAALGLEPGGALGHCYLLPFENRKQNRTEVQFIVGYRGMIDLARRSGQIVSLEARAVYQRDKFKVRLGLDSTLEHEPDWEATDRGQLTFVYAIAKLKDGGLQFEVMSRAEVEKVRAQSKAGSNGPWVSHFEEMAKKTVIRRLFKYLPVSIEIQRAVGLDEQAESGLQQDNPLVIEGEFAEVGEHDAPAEQAGDAASPITAQEVHDAMTEAKNREALDAAFSMLDLVQESERGALQELWAVRAKELSQ